MDMNTIRSIATITLFVLFLGIVWWAFRGKNAERFNEAAMLPFALDEFPEEAVSSPTEQKREGQQR